MCKTCIKLRKAAFAAVRTVLKGEPEQKPMGKNVLRTRNVDSAPQQQ